MERHKWSNNIHKVKGKVTDAVAAQCLKCGYIFQWVKGYATYFREDTVYLKAPKCEPVKIE